jgi:DNA-directed RNA polymerase specialized sigma24 family protein
MTVERVAGLERARTDAAIEAFVAEHCDRLLRLARLVCRDAGDAADAVQVALEHAWRKRSTLRDDALLRPWLDRIVTREAVRISKSRSSWLSRIFTTRADVTWIEPADSQATQPAAYAGLRAAFRQLSPEQRRSGRCRLHEV